MMIGPAPMIRIVEISVRLGIWSRQNTQNKAVLPAFGWSAARGGSQSHCRSTLGCLRRRDLAECEYKRGFPRNPNDYDYRIPNARVAVLIRIGHAMNLYPRLAAIAAFAVLAPLPALARACDWIKGAERATVQLFFGHSIPGGGTVAETE